MIQDAEPHQSLVEQICWDQEVWQVLPPNINTLDPKNRTQKSLLGASEETDLMLNILSQSVATEGLLTWWCSVIQLHNAGLPQFQLLFICGLSGESRARASAGRPGSDKVSDKAG